MERGKIFLSNESRGWARRKTFWTRESGAERGKEREKISNHLKLIKRIQRLAQNVKKILVVFFYSVFHSSKRYFCKFLRHAPRKF